MMHLEIWITDEWSSNDSEDEFSRLNSLITKIRQIADPHDGFGFTIVEDNN